MPSLHPGFSKATSVHTAGSKRGFALLITITLLAFLVLLLVSLASLTRVETQVAGNNQQLAQARQNALVALNIALGQLQRHTGPDQRVTAKADVLTTYAGSPAATNASAVFDTYGRPATVPGPAFGATMPSPRDMRSSLPRL